jgi:rare lipoprotein A
MMKIKQLILSITLSLTSIFVSATVAAQGTVRSGLASYYSDKFHGRKTASGETFNMYKLTAAHRTLPFGTKLKVTCINTGKSTVVTVTDRGPFHGNRALDLSYGAARAIGIIDQGVAKVKIDILK